MRFPAGGQLLTVAVSSVECIDRDNFVFVGCVAMLCGLCAFSCDTDHTIVRIENRSTAVTGDNVGVDEHAPNSGDLTKSDHFAPAHRTLLPRGIVWEPEEANGRGLLHNQGIAGNKVDVVMGANHLKDR